MYRMLRSPQKPWNSSFKNTIARLGWLAVSSLSNNCLFYFSNFTKVPAENTCCILFLLFCCLSQLEIQGRIQEGAWGVSAPLTFEKVSILNFLFVIKDLLTCAPQFQYFWGVGAPLTFEKVSIFNFLFVIKDLLTCAPQFQYFWVIFLVCTPAS